MLGQDPEYADSASNEWYIAARDRRGLVVPLGNNPGYPGTVQSPFADGNGDGFADVDGFGRFVDGSGKPLAVDRPFAYPGFDSGPVDSTGRPQTPIYEYVNTARTPLAAIARSLKTLADPQVVARFAQLGIWTLRYNQLRDAVLPGRGDGTFGAAWPFPESGYCPAAIADFDSDGALDIAAGPELNAQGIDQSRAYLRLGHGDGRFDPVTGFDAPQQFQVHRFGAPRAADWNSDGKPDLFGFYGGFESDGVITMINTSN